MTTRGSLCRVALEGGSLTFQGPRAESYRETVLIYAPDAGDVAFSRAPWRNWRSVVALAGRVESSEEPPETFRFRTPGGRGVVVRHSNRGVERYVAYTYPPRGDAGFVLALSRAPRLTLLAILSSVRFGSNGDR